METSMRWRVAPTLASVLLLASMAHAASINYGNFGPVPPGIAYLNVTESSTTDAVPLYGPPTLFPIGLDFNPTMGSSSTGGSSDITEAQLNFTISGNTNGIDLVEIANVSLFEAGDYTLVGAGGAATSVFAGAIMRITVTEINGLPVAPINFSPLNGTITDSLPPPGVVVPWSLGLGLNFDIATALVNLGFGVNDGATRVDVVINNTLASSSEVGTSASIAKKEFQINTTPGFVLVIPEPTSLGFAGALLAAICVRARRSGHTL